MLFEFTEQEANIVLNGLGNLPYIQSAQLIQKMQEQASNQMKEQVTVEE